MRFRDGFELVQMAYDKVDQEKWYRVWLVQQPNDGAHIILFEPWYEDLLTTSRALTKNAKMSDDDILNHAEIIRERMSK